MKKMETTVFQSNIRKKYFHKPMDLLISSILNNNNNKFTYFLSESESLLLLELLLLLLLLLSALSDLSLSEPLSSEYISEAFSFVLALLDFSSGCSPSSSSPSAPSFSSSRFFSCSIRCCFSFSSARLIYYKIMNSTKAV